MIHIHRTTKNDILDRLPCHEPFSADQFTGRRPISLLICSAGFEDRATAIVEATAGCEIEGLLILRYPTNVEENSRSLESLRGIPAGRVIELTYDRADFRRSIRSILDQFLASEGTTVVLDVSVLSSYLLYRILDALLDHRSDPRVLIYYAEADTYFPQRSEWQRVHSRAQKKKDPLKRANMYERSGFQSLGVDAIYESELHPGRNISALPTQVVAVPNFSRVRMREMLAYAEAQYNAALDETIWVVGQPPNEEKNGWRFEATKELYSPMDNVIPISTRDYKAILWYLSDLWETLNFERHLVIAPLGSKMQHLGIFLFLKMKPDTGLILSEPKAFVASRFSSGVGPAWLLDLGCVAELKDLLAAHGMLQFHWE